MRLLLPILLAIVPAAASSDAPSAAPKPAKPASCPSDRVILSDQGGSVQAKKLGELPPGQLYLTVDRKIDDCRVPVIVRYGIGGRASPPPLRGN